MAISYTVPNTFVALTVAESSKVNANENYTKSIFDQLEAGTASLSQLRIDSNPTAALGVTPKQYVDTYASYRRPVLRFATVTTVSVEAGLLGNGGVVSILFPGNDLRSDSTSTRIVFDITRNAVLSGSAQSGLRTSLSESTNTWYALYAVKVTDSSTNFVIVGDTNLPLQANYSTLNSSFGTNGWVYLGLIRNGDNSGATGDILNFYMAGNQTMFVNSNAPVNYAGSKTGTNLTTSASTTNLNYTYAAGTGNTNIPNNVLIANVVVGRESNTSEFTFRFNGEVCRFTPNAGRTAMAAWGPIGTSVALNNGSAAACDMWLGGFIDGVLGLGSNPLL